MTRCTATFAILFAVLASGTVEAQMFLDDFEDGSATDGMPVSWVAPEYAQTGSREVIDGSFVLTADSRGTALDTDVEGRVYGDVSLRTQFMAAAEDAVGLYTRSTLSGPLGSQGQQLWGVLNGSGRLTLGRLVEDSIETLAERFMGWDPTGQEVHMQMNLFDGLVTLSAWPDVLGPPSSPHLSYDLSSVGDLVDEGRIGIWTFSPQTGALGPVAFRYVQAVPEPRMAFLVAIGAVSAIAIWGRRAGFSRQ